MSAFPSCFSAPFFANWSAQAFPWRFHSAMSLSLALLAAAEGFDKALAVPVQQKLLMHQTVRQLIKNKVRFSAKPIVWIGVLPANPAELKRDHIAVFETMYVSEQAAPNPISVVQLQQRHRRDALFTCTD